jgi:hypothetical protein
MINGKPVDASFLTPFFKAATGDGSRDVSGMACLTEGPSLWQGYFHFRQQIFRVNKFDGPTAQTPLPKTSALHCSP